MLYTSTLTVFDQKQELENTYIVFKGQQNSSTGVWLSGPRLTADSPDDVSFQQATMTGKLSVNDCRSKLIQKTKEIFKDACKKASDA